MLLVAGAPAWASPCSRKCEPYRSLIEAQDLGDQIAEIGISALDRPSTGAFHSDPDLARAYRLKLDASTLVPDECKRYLRKPKLVSVQLVARGTIGDEASPYDSSASEAQRLFNAYNSLVTSSRNGRRGYDAFASDFQSKSADRIVADASSIGVTLNEKDAALLKAYHAILNSGSGPAALAWIKANRDLFKDERSGVLLVQMWGTRFLADYDTARNSAGANAPGSVTLDQLLAAARHNTSVGFSGGGAGPGAQLEGVCRDIASGQGQMLEAMGFKHTVVVSQSQAHGSYHVTLLSTSPDPSHPNRLYRFNYDSLHMAQSGDSRALFEGGSDISIAYRLYKPGGGPMATLPSEMGKFLSEASGFDVRTLDPLARQHGDMIGAGATFRSGTEAHAVVGTDGLGARYALGSVAQEWNQGGNFPGKAGIALGTVNRPAELFGTGKDLNLDLIYAQIEQKFRTPSLKLAPGVQARIEATATAIFMASRSRTGTPGDGNDGKMNYQGDLRAEAGIRVDQKSWNDRIIATYRAGATVGPGITDIRNNDIHQLTPTAVLNDLFFTAEGRLRLSKTDEGRAYLVAATTVLWNELGARGRVEAGVVTPKAGAILSLEGAIADGARYQDGSGRRMDAIVYWQPKKYVQLNGDVWVPVESDLPAKPGGMGSLILKW